MADPPDGGDSPLSGSILAEAPERGGDHYSDLPERVGRLSRRKGRSVEMRDYIAALRPQSFSQVKAAHELHQCGSYLVFRHFLQSDRVRLHGLRSCKLHMLCNLCAALRGVKAANAYLKRVQAVMLERSDLELWMVTLTIRDGEDLDERFRHLHRSVKRLHKRRRHCERYAASEMHKLRGAVWSYEFKRGSGSGLWHPHVHAVWLCERGKGPDQAALSREWLEITGDSHIVEAHALYGDPRDAFCEVFKYAVKFQDLPLADNWHAYEVLKRRRMIASSGLLWGVDVPDELTDELIEEPEWVDLLYRFVRGDGYAFRGIVGSDAEEAYRAVESGSPSPVARHNWSAYWRGVFAKRTA